MGLVHRKEGQRADTIIGVMWAIGVAIGIIFLSLSPGYKADTMSYLFGSILAVSTMDLWLMAGIALLSWLSRCCLPRQLLALYFDQLLPLYAMYPLVRSIWQ